MEKGSYKYKLKKCEKCKGLFRIHQGDLCRICKFDEQLVKQRIYDREYYKKIKHRYAKGRYEKKIRSTSNS